MLSRESEGDKLMKRAAHLCRPSLLELRVKADWNNAAPLYEKAVNTYQVQRDSGGEQEVREWSR